MKALLSIPPILFLSFPLFAQQPTSSVSAACGDLRVSMAVTLDDTQPLPARPQPEMAQVYFIQDTGSTTTQAYPTTKIGIDGKWVGANKKDSYFPAFVPPGEHHLCVAIQSSFVRNNIELAHFTAEAGKVYFYRTRIIMTKDGLEYLGFLPVDSDEGEYLVATYELAKAHPRK